MNHNRPDYSCPPEESLFGPPLLPKKSVDKPPPLPKRKEKSILQQMAEKEDSTWAAVRREGFFPSYRIKDIPREKLQSKWFRLKVTASRDKYTQAFYTRLGKNLFLWPDKHKVEDSKLQKLLKELEKLGKEAPSTKPGFLERLNYGHELGKSGKEIQMKFADIGKGVYALSQKSKLEDPISDFIKDRKNSEFIDGLNSFSKLMAEINAQQKTTGGPARHDPAAFLAAENRRREELGAPPYDEETEVELLKVLSRKEAAFAVLEDLKEPLSEFAAKLLAVDEKLNVAIEEMPYHNDTPRSRPAC